VGEGEEFAPPSLLKTKGAYCAAGLCLLQRRGGGDEGGQCGGPGPTRNTHKGEKI